MWNSVARYLLVLVALATHCSAQAPGDGNERCTKPKPDYNPPTYPDTEKTLMDSYHYIQLLPGNGTRSTIRGAAWNDRSVDGNDETNNVKPTYWQQGTGGICQYQVRVCGWEKSGTTQDNWLFTQHIDKSVTPERDNYPIEIRVDLVYNLQNCRDRLGCKQEFKVYRYITNEQTLPSTSGNGFMNTDNYEQFARVRIPDQLAQSTTVKFTIQPGDTGFYLALRDQGTCLSISRIRVYRYNCMSQQVELVKYPESPSPVSPGDDIVAASIPTECLNNAEVFSGPTISCRSDGTWGSETPVCGCSPGYEINLSSMDRCDICPAGEYQPRVSLPNTPQCQSCPGNSSTLKEGTAVCQCRETFIRHPERPDDPCLRSPSAPRFDLTNTPVLDGTDVTVIWLPSHDSGGDEKLFYDIYIAQLNSSEPVYCRQNRHGIACKSNIKCQYTITTLDPNTSYSLLLVAVNSATKDPTCINDTTPLGSRYLVFIVGTKDATETPGTPETAGTGAVSRATDPSGLSAGTVAGISSTLTLVVTAVVTTLIVLAIVYCILRQRSTAKYSSNTTSQNVTVTSSNMTTTTTINMERNDVYSPPPKEPDTEKPKPYVAKKLPPPSRPVAPHPSRPPHGPKYPPAHNGY